MTRCFGLGILVIFLFAAQFAAAEERVALVIGNANYEGNALRNPINDAAAMEASLKTLNFNVTKKTDVNLAQMEDAVVQFKRTLKKDSIALFFYAGHGLEVKGDNFLMPLQAKIQEEFQVKEKCYKLDQVLSALEDSKAFLKIVILDCCRDNPFVRSWRRGNDGQGLAAIANVPEGTIIAFSTAPGKTALDSALGSSLNSPYTKQLVATLDQRPKEGLEVITALRKASQELKLHTGQTPWINFDSSISDYYLVASGKSGTPPVPTPPASAPKSLVSPFTPTEASAAQRAWAAHLKTEPEITNGIGMKLMLMPPGEFLMGSSAADVAAAVKVDSTFKEEYAKDEQPQHRVRITQPYYLGTYEVTQQEWERVMGKQPSSFSKDGSGKEKVSGLDVSRFPVESILWDDATEFCRKLSQREGKTYRLPTEAEWEYACRAGTTSAFHFGNVLNGDQANVNGNVPFGTATKGKYLQRTCRVGSYSSNSFGLFDMHGNVWEWCQDYYEEGFYAGSRGDDPENKAESKYRVLRGGSWYDDSRSCRSALRGWDSPGNRYFSLGMRVVCLAR